MGNQDASLWDRATLATPQARSGIGHSESIASADCIVCEGAEWVCENHADRPWDGISNSERACGCGAGMPCRLCRHKASCAPYTAREEQAADTIEAALVAALVSLRDFGCPVCSGDCGSANPPVISCPMTKVNQAITKATKL